MKRKIKFSFWLVLKLIKSSYYKLIFKEFGRKSIIDSYVFISNPGFTRIGKSCKIGPFCRIETFPEYAGIKSSPELIIKDGCSLQHAVHIYCREKVVLEKGCLIASGCMITDNNHGINPLGDYYISQPLKSKPTILGEGVWLGENVSILAGSSIGERSIIQSNSVVKGMIPSFSIASGNPAEVIKRFNFSINAWEKI